MDPTKPQASHEEYEPSVQESVEKVDSNVSDDVYNDDLPDSLRNLTPEQIEALLTKTTRKLDLRILPMLVLIYILNYIDRNNIAALRLAGIEEDLNLVGTQYQTCVSILFVGYILMQVPANMFFNKMARPSVFISVVMTIWGAVSACTGAIQKDHGFAGLLVVRIILGVVESAFFPTALFFLSKWYDSKELAFRTTVLYSGSLLSGAFSGLIAAGITDNMEGVRGLGSWRWLFIIEGAITVFVVPFAYFILPDMPHNTKWLTREEQDVVMWKMRRGVGQDDLDKATTDSSYLKIFILTCRDPKTWLITGTLSFLVAACGVTNFFPSVVETLQFNRVITLVLTAPPYLLAVVATYIWARHADKTGERFYHVTIPLVLALVSFIISAATLNTGARYFSMCLMIPSLYCSFTVILTWMSNSMPRPPVKRAVAIALMNCLSNSTSIWNAYLYPSTDAPRYQTAFICNCIFILLAIIMAFLTRLRLAQLNKRIENGKMDWIRETGKSNEHGLMISSDFRYLP